MVSARNQSPAWLAVAKLSSKIRAPAVKCDDAENCLHRSNLLFFGIPDKHGESWEQFEAQVICFSAQKLDTAVVSSGIEHAHRLGHFRQSKHRPIRAHFKDKSNILSVPSKLKEPSFSIRNDFSEQVQTTRRKLYECTEQLKTPSTICFNKLRIDKNSTFMMLTMTPSLKSNHSNRNDLQNSFHSPPCHVHIVLLLKQFCRPTIICL